MVTEAHAGRLRREVGLIGLTFFSLGSIIGSGWLFGAMNAAKHAGPAAVLAWPLAGVMLLTLALIHAELGGMYPMAGATVRFSHYAFGGFGGFTIGWASWIYSMAIAPIEVQASLTYASAIEPLHWLTHKVHGTAVVTFPAGYIVAALLMLMFTIINAFGVKVFATANTYSVWWKIAIPLLTVVTFLFFLHPANFTAQGGFFPSSTNGIKGLFLALPLGVIFAELGFESAVEMAGEARNPRRDVWRAVIYSTLIGIAIYTLLQVAFLGALHPGDIAHGWPNLSFTHDIGPYAGLATVLGLTWLVVLLYADAFISPTGTGLIYTGTQARLLYGMGRERYIPDRFAFVNTRGVPIYGIVFGWIMGVILFLPFPGWETLVSFITSAAVLMYTATPLAMAHLRRADPYRDRPFRLPAASVLNPLGFVFASLLLYWASWQTVWRLLVAVVAGFVLLAISYYSRPPAERPNLEMRHSVWIWPYLVGMGIISYYGAFPGEGGLFRSHEVLPFGWDFLVVAAFALVIYYFALVTALPSERVQEHVARDDFEVAVEPTARAA
ncbi:APC family permease [Actinoallomurus acanthiterrae]